MIGWFIFQIPSSSSRVLVWLDARLKPKEHRVRHRKAVFIWSTLKKNLNPAMIAVFRHPLDSPDDKWTRSSLEIQRAIGIISEFDSKQDLVVALNASIIDYVISVKVSHDTMSAVLQPSKLFSLQEHVKDSLTSKVLCKVHAGNFGLGNRYRNVKGCKFTGCPPPIVNT